MASELSDKLLAELLEVDAEMTVTLHVRTGDQTKAIKTVKAKMSDIDRMKMDEQKKAVRSGYDMDILLPDLITYLAAVMDLCTGKIVGWAMSERMTARLMCDALAQATLRQKPPRGVICHSDRGIRYACNDYRSQLAARDADKYIQGSGK